MTKYHVTTNPPIPAKNPANRGLQYLRYIRITANLPGLRRTSEDNRLTRAGCAQLRPLWLYNRAGNPPEIFWGIGVRFEKTAFKQLLLSRRSTVRRHSTTGEQQHTDTDEQDENPRDEVHHVRERTARLASCHTAHLPLEEYYITTAPMTMPSAPRPWRGRIRGIHRECLPISILFRRCNR